MMATQDLSGDKLLIVNADDLGRSEGINAGTFEAHSRGLVTSATLMVNFPASRSAGAALGDYPKLGVGLHLAFSGGVPTLAPEQVPSLVDESGRLPAKPDGLEGAAPAEILAEVKAQLQRFQELTGRLPTHLDGHHHCHRRPDVFEAVLQVAAELGVPVRDPGPPLTRRLEEAKIPTTDTFVNRFYGDEVQLEILLAILLFLGPGTTELMVHPGHSDDALRKSSSYSDQREEELRLLTHPSVLQAVKASGIRLGHFGDLVHFGDLGPIGDRSKRAR